MPAKFVPVDRKTPMLLPPDLREWIPEDDMVHFVIETVDGLPLRQIQVNERGSGSAQYPPRMMLALLIYCYAHGIFSSRKIERASYRDIAVRYLTGDTHPDHDTIAAFRRKHLDLLAECFEKVLLMARELGVLKLGRVSVDGTHVRADASKDKNVTSARASELVEQLRADIAELMEQAERADTQPEVDGDTLPERINRREKLKAKLEAALAEAEARAAKQHAKEKAAHEAKLKKREQRPGNRRGPKPKPPPEKPEVREDEQVNLSDADSRIMRRSKRASYEQCYNAQAVVDNDTLMIVGERVSQSASDKRELLADLASIPEELGRPEEVLADSGFGSREAVEALVAEGIEPYISVCAESHHRHRCYDYRPRKSKEPKEPRAAWRREMKQKLAGEEGRQIYGERFYSVEPVFGIIKSVMGFRQFSLRGLAKVSGEWSLVATAYNLKRLYELRKA